MRRVLSASGVSVLMACLAALPVRAQDQTALFQTGLMCLGLEWQYTSSEAGTSDNCFHFYGDFVSIGGASAFPRSAALMLQIASGWTDELDWLTLTSPTQTLDHVTVVGHMGGSLLVGARMTFSVNGQVCSELDTDLHPLTCTAAVNADEPFPVRFRLDLNFSPYAYSSGFIDSVQAYDSDDNLITDICGVTASGVGFPGIPACE